MRRRLALLLLLSAPLLLAPPDAPVSAQRAGRCQMLEYEDDALVFEVHSRFDSHGRLVYQDALNDPAAFRSIARYRYRANGELRSVRVNVVEGPTETGRRPLARVTTERRDGVVIVREHGEDRPRVTTYTFDERGLPTHVVVDQGADDTVDTDSTCTYDASGRPTQLDQRFGRDGHVIRTWVYEEGRLARIDARYGEQLQHSSSEVVERRGRRLTVRAPDGDEGSRTEWTGACEPMIVSPCSPVLAPPPR